jgi:hypothetical protein
MVWFRPGNAARDGTLRINGTRRKGREDMRRFQDSSGGQWDVVLGRESWGALFALFVPVSGDDPVRQAALVSSGYDAATQEFNELDDAALQQLLDRSVIKDEGLP